MRSLALCWYQYYSSTGLCALIPSFISNACQNYNEHNFHYSSLCFWLLKVLRTSNAFKQIFLPVGGLCWQYAFESNNDEVTKSLLFLQSVLIHLNLGVLNKFQKAYFVFWCSNNKMGIFVSHSRFHFFIHVIMFPFL